MAGTLSPRLATIVAALPFEPDSRILEIGCGPGAAARAIAAELDGGQLLAIDRSATAVKQALAGSVEEIERGVLEFRQAAIEDFEPVPGEAPFDLVFAVRVGALDGRHPDAGREALQRIAAATTPTARLFVDGGDPLRELEIPR